MSAESREFRFKVIPNVDDCSRRRQRDRLAVRQIEVDGSIIELLSSVRSNSCRKLIGISIGASGPVKCQSGEHRSHGMIDVAGNGAVGAKGNQDLRAKTANMQGQFAHTSIKILAVKLTVRIVQNDCAGDFQNLTSGRKLFASSSR